MRLMWTLLICVCLFFVTLSMAQSQANSAQLQVPRLIRFGGNLQVDGSAEVVGVTFSLYKDQLGGSPLWIETQNVKPDSTGHYSVLLGSQSADGVPSDLFTANEARWLGVRISGQDEQARV